MWIAIQSLFQRAEVRAAAGNLRWLLVEKLVRLALNVWVVFLVARYLGPEDWGALNFALATAGVFALFSELGLDEIMRRRLIAEPGRAKELLATAKGLRLTGAALGAGLLVIFSVGIEGENGLLIVLALTIFQPVWRVWDIWFQARLQARDSTLAQTCALAAGVVARLGLVAAGASVLGFAWVTVAESFLAVGLLAIRARRAGMRAPWSGFRRETAASLLRESWPLLVSGFAIVLYMRLDMVMLRGLAGEHAVGIYAAATRFTESWYFLPGAIAMSVLPALLRAREQSAPLYRRRLQAMFDGCAGLAYLIAVPLTCGASWLIHLAYGPAYAEAAPVLALHIWSLVFIFLGVARGQHLVNEGYNRFYLLATTAGLMVNVLLNWLLIPRYGAWGAACATLLAQAAATLGTTFCFTPLRAVAWMQARALFIPLLWPRYMRSTSGPRAGA